MEISEEKAPSSPAGPITSASTIRTMAIIQGIVMTGVALGLGYYFEEPFWRTLHFTLSDISIGAAAGLGMVFVADVIAKNPIGPLVQIHKNFEKVAGLFRKSTVLDLMIIPVSAGISGELLFRGFMEPMVRGYTGVIGALLIIAHFCYDAFGLLYAT